MAHIIVSVLFVLLPWLAQQKPALKMPGPQNAIQIRENLYMDKAEVHNLSWIAYMQDLRRDSSLQAYSRAHPDTSVWDEVDKSGRLKRRYFRSFHYAFHPVVGVSYEQVKAYNAWRSAFDTQKHFVENQRRLKRLKLENYKVVYRWRLPTQEEWELAAAGGLDPGTHPYGVLQKRYRTAILAGTIIYDSLGFRRQELEMVLRRQLRRQPQPEFNSIKTFGYGFRYGLYITNAVPHYIGKSIVAYTTANNMGFYDMIGNVAEMVAEKGVAKGGSWMHYLDFSKIHLTQTYTTPSSWLGFRSVCEVSLEPL